MAAACFDRLAADYDREWTNSATGRLQRGAVWRELLPFFQPGDRVLDLGCGTGEDAQWLMQLGVQVRAIDASSEMVNIARRRGVDANVSRIEDLGLIDDAFDGIISNFGALNCVKEFSGLRDLLARLVLPGGTLAICLMGQFCLHESLHYLSRLRLRKAIRRWAGQSYSRTLDLRVYYPSASAVQRAMKPHFRVVRRIGVGLAVPPSYIEGISEASLMSRARFDSRAAHLPVLRSMADHQLFIFVRE